MAKPNGLIPALLFAVLSLCVPFQGWADTNAITVTGGNSSGGVVQGAVGFSFIPNATITVTGVSFFDGAAYSDALITFWSSTNSVITNYDLGASSNTQTTISSNVDLTLTAGQPYSVTLQNGPLSAGNYVTVQAYVSGSGVQLAVAPQLTQYQVETVSTNGSFTPGLTNAFLYGVNFSIAGTNGPPLLTIQPASLNSVVVLWPSPSTGYILETNSTLAANNWTGFLGAINDDGTNKSVTISPATGTNFFRLSQ